jgi:hypothetical protein
MSHFIETGTSGPKGELEDAGPPRLSCRSPGCLDTARATGDHFERPDVYSGQHNIEAESKGCSNFHFAVHHKLNPIRVSEALAASVVKVAGRDVLATWKILISLGVAPVLYGFYAFAATVVAIKANASLKWRIATPFMVLISLPFMNYAALKFGEAGMDVLK